MKYKRIQVLVQSQYGSTVQPIDAEAHEFPAQLMQECQEFANETRKPVVFIDRTDERFTFRPE